MDSRISVLDLKREDGGRHRRAKVKGKVEETRKIREERETQRQRQKHVEAAKQARGDRFRVRGDGTFGR